MGQESKILLKNSKRWKNMPLNYKTVHMRVVQPSDPMTALKSRRTRKASMYMELEHLNTSVTHVRRGQGITAFICLVQQLVLKPISNVFSCLKMMSGSIKLPFGNVICCFYGYRAKNNMNSLKGHKITDLKEIKADKLGYPRIKDVYSPKI